VDVICFTEKFLSPNVPDSALSLDGFKLIRKDRVNPPKGYGGLCMYIGEHLKCSLVNIPSSISRLLISDIEFLFVNVFLGNRSYLFGIIYNPPISTKRSYSRFGGSLRNIEVLFGYFANKYDEVVISGDFNLDILRDTTFSRD